MNVLNTYQEFDYNQFDLNVDHYGSENCASNYAFGPSVRDDYSYILSLTGAEPLLSEERQLP